jgi:4-amino-4-deoxy-L-arabinose transferase-like glycosyltransferase
LDAQRHPEGQRVPIPPPRARRERAFLAGALLLALGVRLLHLLAVWRGPFSPAFYLPIDARLYHTWGASWLQGGWPPSLPFERPPLYTVFVGAIYAVAGVQPLAVLLAQVGLGTLSCALAYGIARELFPDPRVARLAVLACALCGPLVYFDAQLLPGSLDVFLGLLLLRLLCAAGRRDSPALWLAAGLAAGLSALNRGGILLFAPFALAFALRFAAQPGAARRLGAGLPAAALFALGLALPLLPVAWHNARFDRPGDASAAAALRRLLAGEFVLIATNSGINFYLGNHLVLRELNRTEHPDHMAVYDRIRQEPSERGIETFSGANRHLVRETLREAVERPRDWSTLAGIKLAELVNGTEIPRNTSLYADRSHSPLLAALLWRAGVAFPSGVLIPFSLLGIGSAARDWRRHFLPFAALACQAAFLLAFFVTSRYRLPMLPLLAVYAASGALALWDSWRHGPRARAERLTGILALLALAANLPIVPVRATHDWIEYYNLGVAKNERGEREAAEALWRRAVQENPADARCWTALCKLLVEGGRPAEALPFCRNAVAAGPGDAGANFELGVALEALARPAEALPYYRQAARLAPGSSEVQAALRRLQERARTDAEASRGAVEVPPAR